MYVCMHVLPAPVTISLTGIFNKSGGCRLGEKWVSAALASRNWGGEQGECAINRVRI